MNDYRARRLRQNPLLRDLVAEVKPDRGKLVMPYFVCEGEDQRIAIPSMPGIERLSIDNLLKDVEADLKLGINKLLLFGIPDTKDPLGSAAYAADGVVQQAIRALRQSFGRELLLIGDVCLCEYTDHGHCGIINSGEILNDPTLELLAKTAVAQAEAGIDIVAPSDMMDLRVAAIRRALDTAGFSNTAILSYSVKYASSFYGPFRDAAGSAPQFGDRKSYQMDYRNIREAEKENLLDISEGADMLMVKPALAYLDILKETRQLTNLPVCAYNVSGEYSMVKSAAANGFIDEAGVVREIMTSFVRAGADFIITYHTRDIYRNNWF